MSRGHKGACFRAHRRTKLRKESQGEVYNRPIRYKVPAALMPFLSGASKGQKRALFDQMGLAILRYNEHAAKVGRPFARTAEQVAAGAAT